MRTNDAARSVEEMLDPFAVLHRIAVPRVPNNLLIVQIDFQHGVALAGLTPAGVPGIETLHHR